MPAVVTIHQPGGAGDGNPGEARNDIWLNVPVFLSASTEGNTSYNWAVLAAPYGNEVALEDPTAATCSFVPDSVGTYRIRLMTNGGGGLGNSSTLVFRVRYDETGLLVNRGWAYPAYGEKDGESNYEGNRRGWALNLEDILEDIRENGMPQRPIVPFETADGWHSVQGSVTEFFPLCTCVERDEFIWGFDYERVVKFSLYDWEYTGSYEYVNPYSEAPQEAVITETHICTAYSAGFSFESRTSGDSASFSGLNRTGAKKIAVDPDTGFVWIVNYGWGTEGVSVHVLNTSLPDIDYVHFEVIPNPAGNNDNSGAITIHDGYLYLTDNGGNLLRMLMQDPWTVETLAVVNAHPGHTDGNSYRCVGMQYCPGFHRIACAFRFYTGTLFMWAMFASVDADMSAFTGTNLLNLTGYLIDPTTYRDVYPGRETGLEEIRGLAFAEDSVWISLERGFVEVSNLYDVPSVIRVINSRAVQDAPGAYDFSANGKLLQITEDSYYRCAWWGLHERDDGSVTNGVVLVTYRGTRYYFPHAEKVGWLPVESVTKFKQWSDLQGELNEAVVGKVRGIVVPTPTEADVGKVLTLQGAPDWVSPNSIVSDERYLYVAECGLDGASPGSAIIRKFSVSRGEYDETLGANRSILLPEGQVDLSEFVSTDRVSSLAQYGRYLFAACWDNGNIAVIDKDTLAVLGWGYMADGMGATYRAGTLCADDFGNVYCYSADINDILAKFELNGMLGRIPDDGIPIIFVTSVGGPVFYGAGFLWQVDKAPLGFGVRKIELELLTEVTTNNPIAGFPAFHAVVVAQNSVWALYATGATTGVAHMAISDLSLQHDCSFGIDIAFSSMVYLPVTNDSSAYLAVFASSSNRVGLVRLDNRQTYSNIAWGGPNACGSCAAFTREGTYERGDDSQNRLQSAFVTNTSGGAPGIYEFVSNGWPGIDITGAAEIEVAKSFTFTAASSPASVEWIYSYTDRLVEPGPDVSASLVAGDFTVGTIFVPTSWGLSITGVTFYLPFTDENLEFECAIWDVTGGGALTSNYVTVTGSGKQTCVFAAPVTLVANNSYAVSIYETSGTSHIVLVDSEGLVMPQSIQMNAVNGPRIIVRSRNTYAAGYAIPITGSETDRYIVDPILEYDSEALPPPPPT